MGQQLRCPSRRPRWGLLPQFIPFLQRAVSGGLTAVLLRRSGDHCCGQYRWQLAGGERGEEECAPGQDVPRMLLNSPSNPPCDLFTPLPVSHGPGPYARGPRQVLGAGSHSREESWPPHRRGILCSISHCHNSHFGNADPWLACLILAIKYCITPILQVGKPRLGMMKSSVQFTLWVGDPEDQRKGLS